jgi:hypothetical protein
MSTLNCIIVKLLELLIINYKIVNLKNNLVYIKLLWGNIPFCFELFMSQTKKMCFSTGEILRPLSIIF